MRTYFKATLPLVLGLLASCVSQRASEPANAPPVAPIQAVAVGPALRATAIKPKSNPVLPAGLYFRAAGHYSWNCHSCETPAWVVAEGPFQDGAPINRAIEAASRGAQLEPGYPWVVHTKKLGLSPEQATEDGYLVVTGLFAHKVSGARKLMLDGAPYLKQLAKPKVEFVQTDRGAPVPAYSRKTMERVMNMDEEEGKGEYSSLVRAELGDAAVTPENFLRALNVALGRQKPLCELPADRTTRSYGYPGAGYYFVAVRCPDGKEAHVMFDRTRIDSVVLRSSHVGGAVNTFTMVQPIMVECDTPHYNVWNYSTTGRSLRRTPPFMNGNCGD